MPPLLLYLLKANAALLLLAGLYYLALRRLTFYGLNRAYLLFALLFSALYPALDIAALIAPQVQVGGSLLTIVPNWAGSLGPPAAAGPDWQDALMLAYWAGVALMGGRLVLRLGSLYRLHRASVPAVVAGEEVRCLPGKVSPFSFGSTIYLNPAHYSAAELPAILHHELVHVRQAHTLDMLLVQVGQALCWFNPAAWWLGRAVQQNLEFLTDAAVLRAGLVSAKTYQYSLLRLSGLASGAALATHFTFLTLKTRIMMMNKPASARACLVQYALVLPLAALLALGFDAPTASAQPTTTLSGPAAGLPDKVAYYIDGQRVTKEVFEQVAPETIANMNVLKDASVAKVISAPETQAILLTTKANENAPAVIELNKKLNRLVDLNGKLLLVNEREVTRAEFERLLPTYTRQIMALEPKKAVEAHGEKGRNGSVQMTTK